MDIIYGLLEVSGDFTLRNVKELGYDRDFILLLPSPVVRLSLDGFSMQVVQASRLLLRASLSVPEITCHFLANEDLQSAVANFTYRGDKQTMTIEKLKNGQTLVRLVTREEDQ